MKTNHIFVFAFISFLFAVSCTKSDNGSVKEQTKDSTGVISVSDQLLILSDSADAQWDKMMEADSQKFADIKRLLEEISYCKKYNEKAVAQLLKYREEVFAIRYTQTSMNDSLIDLYDEKTTDLINKVRNLKSQTEEIVQHPLAAQLENEIIKADSDDILVYRKNYDQIVEVYNSFLEANKEAIAKNPSLNKYQKKKTFSVPATSQVKPA